MKMVDRIEVRMKLEPGVTYVRPPCRLVGIGNTDQLSFSEMPLAPGEDDEDTSVMAHEVGITDDATIAAAAAAGIDEPLCEEEVALSAKAGATEPSVEHEEEVDYGGGSVHSSPTLLPDMTSLHVSSPLHAVVENVVLPPPAIAAPSQPSDLSESLAPMVVPKARD